MEVICNSWQYDQLLEIRYLGCHFAEIPVLELTKLGRTCNIGKASEYGDFAGVSNVIRGSGVSVYTQHFSHCNRHKHIDVTLIGLKCLLDQIW